MAKVMENGRVNVDAHQLGRALVLGYRAHRGADLALAGEQHQSDHDDNAGCNGNERHLGDLHLTAEQAKRLAGNDRGKGLRVGGPDQQRRILQEVRNADGRDQHRQRRRHTQRLVGKSLNNNTERGADNNSQHNAHPRRPAEIGGSAEAHVAAYHDNIAVREVQHLGNAVNHRVAECDDGVDAAQTDAADQMIQKAHGLEHLILSFKVGVRREEVGVYPMIYPYRRARQGELPEGQEKVPWGTTPARRS